MKASFSHLQRSVFEGSLAGKLRFHIFNFQFLRKVSHEMRFEKLVGSRNASFCIKKRASEDG